MLCLLLINSLYFHSCISHFLDINPNLSSECIRSIIGEYRRSLDTLDVLKKAIDLAKLEKEVELSNGDTKTDIND